MSVILSFLLDLGAIVAWTAGVFAFVVAGSNAVLFSMERPPARSAAVTPSGESTVTVLVAAKSWQKTLEKTLRNIDEIEYPETKLDITLVLGGPPAPPVGFHTNHRLSMLVSDSPESKPQALNRALGALASDCVLLLDEDSLVEKDCIRRMLPLLRDPKIASVVGLPRLTSTSKGLLQSTLALEAEAWTRVARAKDSRGLFLPSTGFFSLLRVSAIREVGGWDGHMLAEDAELSLRLFSRGWRTRLSDARVGIEAPLSLGDLARQRLRWYKGLFDALSKDLGLLDTMPLHSALDAASALVTPLVPACLLVLAVLAPLWPQTLVPAVLSLLVLETAGATWSARGLPASRGAVVLFAIPYMLMQGAVALLALGASVLGLKVTWARTPKSGDV